MIVPVIRIKLCLFYSVKTSTALFMTYIITTSNGFHLQSNVRIYWHNVFVGTKSLSGRRSRILICVVNSSGQSLNFLVQHDLQREKREMNSQITTNVNL